MADQDNICRLGLVWHQPFAKVVPGDFDGAIRLVAGVDFGVNNMGFLKGVLQVVVDMGWKGSKGAIIAHEAVDIENQQGPASLWNPIALDRRDQRMSRRRTGVIAGPLSVDGAGSTLRHAEEVVVSARDVK